MVGYNSDMIGIVPHRHQFHFPCWIIYKKPAFLESHNKIIDQTIPTMAQWDRIGTMAVSAIAQIQYDRDQSLPTPISFSMLV